MLMFSSTSRFPVDCLGPRGASLADGREDEKETPRGAQPCTPVRSWESRDLEEGATGLVAHAGR